MRADCRSLDAYDTVLIRVLDYAGCSRACIGQCDCTCNQSGAVWEALTSDPVPYCTADVCKDPSVVRMMNFPATEFECDSVLAIALRSIYQLCGKTNGVCRNGACTDESCIRTVDNACIQQRGVGRVPFLLISGLAVGGTILFLWGWSDLAIKEAYVALESDSPPPYIATKEKRPAAEMTSASFADYLG